MRLQGGSNHLEGRLEICINDAWGTICQDEFTSDEARIVCANLGFTEGRSAVIRCVAASQSVCIHRCAGGYT